MSRHRTRDYVLSRTVGRQCWRRRRAMADAVGNRQPAAASMLGTPAKGRAAQQSDGIATRWQAPWRGARDLEESRRRQTDHCNPAPA